MSAIVLTLPDLAPVAEILAETGWTGPTVGSHGWTWDGHRAPGEPVRVRIRADGELSVFELLDGSPRRVRWVEVGDDIRQIIDELATAGILSWAHHSAADLAFASILDDGDYLEWRLTDEALAVLASGEASGAGEVLGV